MVEGKAPLIPQLTLYASLKQSIGRSNLGTYRYETFSGHTMRCTAAASDGLHLPYLHFTMCRRLLHLSFEASPLQLLLCGSALDRLSALSNGLHQAAQDSSITALISRRSLANLHEVLAPLTFNTNLMQIVNVHKSIVQTLTSLERGLSHGLLISKDLLCRRQGAQRQNPTSGGPTLELTQCTPWDPCPLGHHQPPRPFLH